ncbi:extended synaptotagmin-1 isoform X1 [Carex littledalei]|uniref:Extended synaptotagmin-1 isoform X1 n=1 Tax=Carex littledalei TaxID=544730 RepID=A0A833R3I9_9POAL|nr:extended synaptotagmin-1 isoform X1 [Carex littledalei]
MVKKRHRPLIRAKEVVSLINQVIYDRPLVPFLIPLFLFAWALERWLVPFSNWVPLAASVWATILYGKFQRQILIQDLNSKWERLILFTAPTTPIEPCAWTNKLFMEIWPNYFEPKLSRTLFSTVERRLKNKRPKLIEKIELQELTLGSCPPALGQNGVHWITANEQPVLRMGFGWDTNEMSVMFSAKLAKPLAGTARIVINSVHIKGDLLLRPILDGQAILYSFESAPEVRINVAFGGGNAQSLPSTEFPGVSSWLVKLLSETIAKLMVEPRRLCFTLPPVNLRKKAVGGTVSVTVKSAANLRSNDTRSNGDGRPLRSSSVTPLQTVVEVEIGELMRKTSMCEGSNPTWDSTFNMVLHGESGSIKFTLYELDSSGVRFNYLTSCDIMMKYMEDDSTVFWGISNNAGVVARHAEEVGKSVEMLAVSLVVKEWQYSDGSASVNNPVVARPVQPSIHGSVSHQTRTGRRLKVTVVEGRNLAIKEKSGRCDPYIKLHYGKAVYRTKVQSHTENPVWNHSFELDEIAGGEYLKIKCFNADRFSNDNIGSARVALDGIAEGASRDVWVPLEKVSSGEIRLKLEFLKTEDTDAKWSSGRYGNRWVELVIIEAKDLVAADISGTSDPFVRVQYGNAKKQTKVIHKTLNPYWNHTVLFPDTGSQLVLSVKDHNAVLPSVSIGNCIVEYDKLQLNQTSDRWIPLQGAKSGQVHVQITRRSPELEKKTELESTTKAHMISNQMREVLKKLKGLVEEGDLDALSNGLNEIENAEDAQVEYMDQLERERSLLVGKIGELDHEINRTTSTPARLQY